MLNSRKISREKFVTDFENTLMPGIIERKKFIDWNTINKKIIAHKIELEFFEELLATDSDKLSQLRDSLLSADNPEKMIKLCFELIAHTQPNFITKQDKIDISKLSEKIKKGNQKEAQEFINLLKDLGFEEILTLENIQNYFLGILIGLETHKRKNLGGKSFINEIKPTLEKIVLNLNSKGFNLKLTEEEKILYGNTSKQSKKVDFAIIQNDKPSLGIEVNFYTNTGSKPTEIKRSYGQVNNQLSAKKIELIWITDGFGYTLMKKSLGDAFEIHPNIYNTQMVKKVLEKDIEIFLNNQ